MPQTNVQVEQVNERMSARSQTNNCMLHTKLGLCPFYALGRRGNQQLLRGAKSIRTSCLALDRNYTKNSASQKFDAC